MENTESDGEVKLLDMVYLPELTQVEAKAEAQKRGMDILRMREIDSLKQQGILSPDLYALWTGTGLEYEGTKGKITEDGKTYDCTVPEKDGWYKQDRLGLPLGTPSNSNDPDARYLWRRGKNSGLLVRGDGGFYGRRDVYAICDDYGRFGVLLIKR